VLAELGVHFMDLSESIAFQLAGEPDECGPEPPMHIGNLPAHQPADEHVRGIPHETSQREDLVALWVTPPVPANALACCGVSERGHWSMRRLENNSMPLNKLQRSSAIHCRLRSLLSMSMSNEIAFSAYVAR
jgi:hypothetical protein